jgi:hypothetical protein
VLLYEFILVLEAVTYMSLLGWGDLAVFSCSESYLINCFRISILLK